MSSYASQSQHQHQNTDQTTEASQSETQQSPPQGNQAQVESAGLEGGGCDDDSMNGPFAHLLLDGMPLGAAIDTALRCLENPVVQDWLRHIPDAHLIDLFADDPSLIDFILSGVMPVGTGIELAGETAAQLTAGVDFGTTASVVRTAVDHVRLEAHPAFKVSMREGIGGKVVDAFGNGVEASAGAGAEVVLRADYINDLELSLITLLQFTGAKLADVIIQAALSKVIQTAVLVPAFPELSDQIDGVSDHDSIQLLLGKKAEATARFDSPDMLPGSLAGPVETLLEDHVLLNAEALAKVRLMDQGSLSLNEAGMATVALDSTVGAIASLAVDIDGVFNDEDVAHLDAMASLGCSAHMGMTVELDLVKLAEMEDATCSTSVSLAVHTTAGLDGSIDGTQTGATTKETELTFHSISEAARAHASTSTTVIGAPSGDRDVGRFHSLTEIIDAGDPGPTITERVRLPLDAERLADEISDFADFIGVDALAGERNVGLVSSDSEILLSGAVAVTTRDYERAAQTGIIIQGDMGIPGWSDLAESIRAARGTGATPSWLTPWAAALRTEFAGEAAMPTARLSGFIGVGVGGALALEAGVHANGKATATARYLVEKSATEQDILQLLAAM